VHDSGHLADPLAGRHHPAPYDLAEAGGHGLRLVHDLCDLVRIHTQPEATTIRLHMRIPRAGGDTADGATGRGGSRAPSLPPASPVPPARPPTGPLQRPTWPEPAEPDPDDQNVDGTGDGGSDGDGDGEVGAARGDEAPEALPPSASPPASAPPASAFPEADALWADSPGAVVRATVTRQAAYTRDAVRYEVRTQLFHHWRRRVVDLLPLRPGEVVLDVGCGSGLCFPLLQQCIGPGGTIIGIETAPEMLALARQQILERGWRNVVLVESAAEDAVIPRRADHALFCAVHDVLQSPAALRTVLARVRPGGTVAAVGGKWAPPWAVGLNTLVAATHAPFVRNFTGFDRPWAGLAPHLTNFLIREIEMGCGYLAAGQTPADNQVGGLT
jgi:demethylmenaquinone methyltransferase/2-methoxy-6-polyprenyl-1,4-benzoquinol methylase